MRRSTLLFAATLLAGCSGPAPRYGEATISAASPRATLSGTTFGEAAALELAPGCPGYLDPAQPAHVVHVSEEIPLTIRASSDSGPVALAVARGDEVRCDSDEGAGHSPELSFTGPGDYLVYVAALRAPAELPYTLAVASGGAAGEAPAAVSGARDVSVTITSQPSGATVRDADGRVVGTTPAMFVVSLPADRLSEERSWVLDLAGHRSVTVSGTVADGALVLHGQLLEAGPTVVSVSATEPQPIRDYQTASLAVDVSESCPISAAEVGVDLRHTFVGDLRVVLHTPWRDALTLQRHTGGSRRNLRQTWTLNDLPLRSLAGRPTQGRWQLVVHDDAGADQGTLDRFDLRLTCGDGEVAIVSPLPAPEPPGTTPAVPAPPRAPRLPELPVHSDIVSVLARLRPSIEQRCAQAGGSVRVYFTVTGASGAVQSVTPSGTASSGEQSCVAQIVRGARFPRFRRSSLDVDYTYDLPRRTAAAQPGMIDPWAGRAR